MAVALTAQALLEPRAFGICSGSFLKELCENDLDVFEGKINLERKVKTPQPTQL